MFNARSFRIVLFVLIAALPSLASAQGTTAPPIDFSGVIYGNYQYRSDSASKAALGQKAPNKFDVERVYLTFRMPAGEKASIRVTTDIFQNANGAYYNGWTARLKYGYLQYNFSKSVLGRVGMLHTVLIDHEETFWPRWISQAAVERAGFFSSSDVGIASQVTLSNKMGEIYATITNGNGYSAAETDRFKDFAARLSLTPFGRDSGFLRTFTITPWFYKGATGSAVPTQFTDGLQKDRFGIFAGVKDRRLAAGLEWARRLEDIETITGAAPTATQTLADRTGQLMSVFAIARPAEWANKTKKSPLGLVARMDMFKPNNDVDAKNTLLIVGAFWDLTSRASFSVDYQGLTYSDYPTPPGSPPESKTLFAHWAVSF